ncbi:MAG: hypothetical protein JKY01_07760 [Pseudomonadales bacterium]|nr:hypothetical protein [Pseudomonadales bacterium]
MRPNRKIQTVSANNHLHGAAIVANDGQEVVITESMMQRAFEQFENRNFHPSSLMLQAKAFKKHSRKHSFQLKLV